MFSFATESEFIGGGFAKGPDIAHAYADFRRKVGEHPAFASNVQCLGNEFPIGYERAVADEWFDRMLAKQELEEAAGPCVRLGDVLMDAAMGDGS